MKTAPAFNRNRFTSVLRLASAGTLVFAGAAMALFAAKPSAPDAPNGGPKNGVYIVQMKASPVVSYTGDIHVADFVTRDDPFCGPNEDNQILSNDLQLRFCHPPRRWKDACCGDFYFRGSGNFSVTVVPQPGLLSMTAEPPWRSTIDFTKARPRPAPSEPREDSAR